MHSAHVRFLNAYDCSFYVYISSCQSSLTKVSWQKRSESVHLQQTAHQQCMEWAVSVSVWRCHVHSAQVRFSFVCNRGFYVYISSCKSSFTKSQRAKTISISAFVASCTVIMYEVSNYCEWLKVSGAFSPSSIFECLDRGLHTYISCWQSIPRKVSGPQRSESEHLW